MRRIRDAALIASAAVLLVQPIAHATPLKESKFGATRPSWVATFNREPNFSDQGRAVAVSPDGARVYVTGPSFDPQDYTSEFVTIAYDAATGTQLWEAEYDVGLGGESEDIAVSPDGATVVIGGRQLSSVVIAYDSATGAQRWVALGPDDSGVFAVAIDASGTVAVTGYLGYFSVMATTGYSLADGTQLWQVKRTHGFEAVGLDLTVAPDGSSFYVAGSAYTGNSYEFLIQRIEGTTGRELWTTAYDGPEYDEAYAVSVSPDGSRVYVAGCIGGVYCVDSHIGTVAYDSDGHQLWVATSSETSAGRGVTVSPDGREIVVTGWAGYGTGRDYETIAYDIDGVQQWVATYDGSATAADFASAIGISPDGCCVFVAGASAGIGTHFDYAVVSYDLAKGSQRWVRRYDGPAQGRDVPRDLAIGPDGTVFVTGQSPGHRTGQDFATVAIGD